MQSNKWFQLIYGLAEIALDSTTGTVTFAEHGERVKNRIDIGDLESVTVRNRILWKKLNLTYRSKDKDRTVELSGFKSVECGNFVKELKQLVDAHAHELVKKLPEKTCHSQLKNLKAELKESGYIRRSHVQGIIGASNLPVFEHVLFLTSQVYSQYSSPQTKKTVELAFCKLQEVYTEIKAHNSDFCDREIMNYCKLFDAIEKFPLNTEQRIAIVHDEDANLIVAGAGTGKTSTIVGKVAYLLEKQLCRASEILLLAYNATAAAEIRHRVEEKCKLEVHNISTFHAFGLDILAEANNLKPTVSNLAREPEKLKKFILSSLSTIFENPETYQIALEFFAYYLKPTKLQYEVENIGMSIEYRKGIATLRDSTQPYKDKHRTIQRDLVKSIEECRIANFLFINGIDYEYEAKYKHKAGDRYHGQYTPDFYLRDYDIYIEHFGVNENGQTAPFVDEQEYREGMRWKRELHKKHETTLVETYSYEHRNGTWQTNLKKKLRNEGVRFNPISRETLKEAILKTEFTNRFTKLSATFLQLFKGGALTTDEIKAKAKGTSDELRVTAFLVLFEQIFSMYESELKTTNEIDFYDMIDDAISIIQEGLVRRDFKYIIIDEFQDISMSRLRLVKAVLEKNPGSSLFCVGDDWQSIYRFAGADCSIMTNFDVHIDYAKTLILPQTYRFPNDLADLSSKFVQKNSHQIKKALHSNIQADDSSVWVIKYAYGKPNEKINAIRRAFVEIEKVQQGVKASVFILGRYKKSNSSNIKAIQKTYPHLKIEFMTCHSAKGLEADFVIVLDLVNNNMGFPCQIENDPLIDLCLSESDSFDYSEERRLFYVAMTRAKKRLFLCAPDINDSVFIGELMETGNTNIQIIELDNAIKQNQLCRCEECKTGYYVTRQSSNGRFWGCTNYPYCQSTKNKNPCTSK